MDLGRKREHAPAALVTDVFRAEATSVTKQGIFNYHVSNKKLDPSVGDRLHLTVKRPACA